MAKNAGKGKQKKSPSPASGGSAANKPSAKKQMDLRCVPLLGPNALRYCHLLAGPQRFPLCGIPDDDVEPSEKALMYAKGDFTTGNANGLFGFVAVAPTPANDSNCVYYSDSTTVDTAITTTTTATHAKVKLLANGRYAAASFDTGAVDSPGKIRARMVAGLLRVRCLTAPINATGQLVGLAPRDHATTNGLTETTMADNVEARSFSIPSIVSSKDWVNLVYHPLPEDSEFKGTSGNFAWGQAPILAFVIKSSSAQSFEWEFYQAVEFVGTSALSVTPSVADPAGYSAVQMAISSQPETFRPWIGTSEQMAEKLSIRASGALATMSGLCMTR